ncbi:hypothetical protein [Myceligenerans xiligouense]|nr:hypothetical protein [Myceligenerans xiligouense]
MEEQGEHREIRTSAPEGEKKARRRRPVIATGVSALVTALVCGGGLALAGRGGDPAPAAGAAVSPLPIPMIMSVDDLEGVDPQDLPGGLERSTARLAEAVRAGEQVYEAARPTAAPRALERLRAALDEATAALEEEPARDATAKQQTKRLRTLDGLRTKILDAAARITAVRTVPGSELPPGTTTAVVAPDDAVVPAEDGAVGPAGEASGGDTVSADGSDGSDGSDAGGSTGSGDSGGSNSGGSGGSGGAGDGGDPGDDGDDDPVIPPPPTRSPAPAPSPPPSSPAPSPSPSGSA